MIPILERKVRKNSVRKDISMKHPDALEIIQIAHWFEDEDKITSFFKELDCISINMRKLKAAIYYSTTNISEQSVQQENVTLSRQTIAGIAETVWKHCQQLATDLESFAKHGKRTTITVDDVKLLVRNSPTLLAHLTEMHERQTEDKQQTKKQRKPSKKKSTTSARVTMETDEDSNMV